jgi:hypothetical protein
MDFVDQILYNIPYLSTVHGWLHKESDGPH